MDISSRVTTKSSYKIFYFLLFSLWTVLFLLGASLYQGSWYTYSFFSLVYLALILSGLFRKATYGYIFLTIMLWLGFWLKTVVHLLLDYPFVEPTGLFKGTGAEWDSVLFVASLGALGVIFARFIFSLFFGNHSNITAKPCSSLPNWYERYRIALWSVLATCMIIFSALNIYFCFQQIGLVPKTIIWPLNAIFSWLLSTGLAMATATLLWWEFLSKKRNINTTYFLLLEAMTSSVSLLSRGLFIFHIIPLYFSVFLNRKLVKSINFRWMTLLLLATFVAFIICFPLINAIRDYHYSAVAFSIPWELKSKSMTELGAFFEKSLMKFAMFSVDRWIGLEGLMAISAYPDKDLSVFLSLATEKAAIGKVSIFQEIALSHYRLMDSSKFLFASLPGPIAFFYLSNSIFIVVAGMSIATLLVMMTEVLVSKILQNPFIAALWGSIFSNAVAQMGINTPGLLTYFLLCSFGIFTLYLFQHGFFIETLSFGKRKR